MSEPAKAVFLSYASQDAEAAKRIADALRATGVEVWFDAEGGLEHGDEWDAKIRRQIKECVLFLPIISANTQAREEGYFRIEWDLAAERARGIASGVAFILPVIIDGTKEPDALVPDRFRSVQWTRLSDGVVPSEVLQRFLKLWSHRTGALKHRNEEQGARSAEMPASSAVASKRTSPALRYGLAAFGLLVLALAGYVIFRSRRSPEEIAKIVPNAPALVADATRTSAPTRTGFPRDPDLARAIALTETLNSTVEDHALAEDLAKAVLARQPTDPETVIVNAYVENRFILRGFDLSEERYATARRLCERAVLLAPDHPEALHVLGQFLVFRQADLPRAVELLRRAVTLQPGQARFYNSYIEALDGAKAPETVQVAEAAAARFPDDPIIHYRLALTYAYGPGRLDAYEKALRETIAIGPVATALIRMSSVMMIVHRDIPGARAWLDRLPGAFRLNDRAVFARYALASASGEPADVENALRLLSAVPGGFLNDFGLWPKRMLIGDLYARTGKVDLARREYEGALADIAQEEARNPQLKFDRVRKWLLVGLGRKAEARETANLTYATATRPYSLLGSVNTWFGTINTLLLLDERAKAIELLREAVKDDWSRRVLAGAFAIDPHLAPWRDDPEIQALLAEPEKATVAVPANDKSVAVLAFANLSDDKANEYFSDGISEELLNVLAKVPKLKVAARTSSFYFKGRDEPIPEIAQKLGVAYVVEGSVRKAGNKVRITAQLIKAADGFHVWSETYDRELTDIFAVQDEIAKNILGIVKGSLLGGEQAPQTATTKIEAYTIYLQAQSKLANRGAVSLREAIQLFDAALAIDPDYIPALVGLARAAVVLPNYASLSGAEARATVDRAKAAAARVLELDSRNAAAYTVLGWAHALAEWHWSEGEAELLKAQELAPNDPWVANFIGDYHRFAGDNRASVAAKQLAWQLDPLSRVSHWDLGFAYVMAGDYDQAVHWGESAIALAPHNFDSYQPVILAAIHRGQLDLMRRTLAAARQNVHEDEGFLILFEVVCAIAEKDTAAARRFLGQAEAKAQAGQASFAYVGYCHLLLGDSAEALRWLQLGYDRRDQTLIWAENIDYDVIAANPVTRPILDLPELKELYALRQRNARANLK